MECSSAREAISALLDGEPAGGPVDDALQRHLLDCAECRHWRDRAHEVTRRFRVSGAEAAPAPGDALLAAVRATSGRPRRNPLTLTRATLAAVAAAQVAVTLPALLFGSDHGSPMHVAHEMGSFDMALAMGFLVAAWRPARVAGMGVVVGAAALLLVVTALVDLGAGRTSAMDEAPHLLVVAGWLLLRRLQALAPSPAEERAAPALPAPLRALAGRASPRTAESSPEAKPAARAIISAPPEERRACERRLVV
jgi:predicted anti-sigma-YlaC factor YlaD